MIRRRRSRRGPLVQAAVLSLTAVATIVAVVRAARRDNRDTASTGSLPTAGERVASGGTDRSAPVGAAAGRGSETAGWVATTS